MSWFDILKVPFYDKNKKLPPYFPSRGGKTRQKNFKKWVRPFIRKYLEKLAVGDTITTAEVIKAIKNNYGKTQKRNFRVTPNAIGTLIGENRDIIRYLRPNGGWRRI